MIRYLDDVINMARKFERGKGEIRVFSDPAQGDEYTARIELTTEGYSGTFEMPDLLEAIELAKRICYLALNPRVEYTVSQEGRVVFANDEDAVHYLLSCGGKAR